MEFFILGAFSSAMLLHVIFLVKKTSSKINKTMGTAIVFVYTVALSASLFAGGWFHLLSIMLCGAVIGAWIEYFQDEYEVFEKPVLAPKPKSTSRPQEYRFRYLDGEGKLSHRHITIERMYSDKGRDKVDAWCHDTHAERTFRIDRIQGLVTCMDTGEMLDPIVWFRRLS